MFCVAFWNLSSFWWVVHSAHRLGPNLRCWINPLDSGTCPSLLQGFKEPELNKHWAERVNLTFPSLAPLSFVQYLLAGPFDNSCFIFWQKEIRSVSATLQTNTCWEFYYFYECCAVLWKRFDENSLKRLRLTWERNRFFSVNKLPHCVKKMLVLQKEIERFCDELNIFILSSAATRTR